MQKTARQDLLRLKKPERNTRNMMPGERLLESLPAECAALAFGDPQYRSVLDKQNYGNEGMSRGRERSNLPQMSEATIRLFVREFSRILRSSGHLMMWADKFTIGSGAHISFLQETPFQIVDLISWNKLKMGMGRRARCVTEYVIVVQKPPIRAKGCWSDHAIRDCWAEMADRSTHPHAKPHQLTERLIRATTKRGDLVVDPCAGGYGVLHACLLSGREFIGCDIRG